MSSSKLRVSIRGYLGCCGANVLTKSSSNYSTLFNNVGFAPLNLVPNHNYVIEHLEWLKKEKCRLDYTVLDSNLILLVWRE